MTARPSRRAAPPGADPSRAQVGSVILGLGTSFAIEGPVNTFLRAQKLFPGPHLYAGAGVVVCWAMAASLVPLMAQGKEAAPVGASAKAPARSTLQLDASGSPPSRGSLAESSLLVSLPPPSRRSRPRWRRSLLRTPRAPRTLPSTCWRLGSLRGSCRQAGRSPSRCLSAERQPQPRPTRARARLPTLLARGPGRSGGSRGRPPPPARDAFGANAPRSPQRASARHCA